MFLWCMTHYYLYFLVYVLLTCMARFKQNVYGYFVIDQLLLPFFLSLGHLAYIPFLHRYDF